MLRQPTLRWELPGWAPARPGTRGPTGEGPTRDRTVTGRAVLHAFLAACGFDDLTEGMFAGDPSCPYEVAQMWRTESLLDRVGCRPGTRLLEIGCGSGRILRAAGARGVSAWGVTTSPGQVRRGQRAGLDVRLHDYRDLGPGWEGRFEGVIANGPLGHLVPPPAARHDEAYRDLFATAHRLLDTGGPPGRFVTTAIHFRGPRPDPNNWLLPPTEFPEGSGGYHWSRLAHTFGIWYPVRGQLEACARGYFELIDEEDGTEDYRFTSEAWVRALRANLSPPAGIPFWLRSWPAAVRRPASTVRVLRCLLGSESWSWQFRGTPPPVVVLRHTWLSKPR